MVNVKQFFNMIQSSWVGYKQFRSTLWLPFFFLITAPLVTIITFVIFILLLNNVGILGDMLTELIVSSKRAYVLLFLLGYSPLLYVCSVAIVRFLQGQQVDDDLLFHALKSSKGSALVYSGTILLFISFIGIFNYFLSFSLNGIFKIVLLIPIMGLYVCMKLCSSFLVPIMAVEKMPIKQVYLKILSFSKQNILGIIGVWLTVFLTFFIILIPTILLMILSHFSLGICVLLSIALIPLHVVLLIKLLPYTVFLPCYFYVNQKFPLAQNNYT